MLLFTRVSTASSPVPHAAHYAKQANPRLCLVGGVIAASVAFVAAIGWGTSSEGGLSDRSDAPEIVQDPPATLEVVAIPLPR